MARLSEIAAYLQQKRLELSVPLEYIEKNTQIRVRLLQSLEEGQFEALPEPIYIKGFIRLYGKAIGIDGDFLAQDFAQISQIVPQAKLTPEQVLNEPNKTFATDFNWPQQLRLQYIIPYLLLLLGATAGLSYIVRQSTTKPQIAKTDPESTVTTTPQPAQSPETKQVSQQKPKPKLEPEVTLTPDSTVIASTALTTQEQNQDTPPATVKSSPQPNSTPTPSTTTTSTATTAVPGEPKEEKTPESKPATTTTSTATTAVPEEVKEAETPESKPATTAELTPTSSVNSITAPVSVNMKLEGSEAWLRVIVDGKTEYEGTLTPGEQRTWNAQEEIKIRSGNAGAVILSTNQSPPQAMGTIGQVKDITITPKLGIGNGE